MEKNVFNNISRATYGVFKKKTRQKLKNVFPSKT